MGIPSSHSAKDGRPCSFRPNWGATLRWILLLWIMGSTITGCGGCGGCTNRSSPQGKKQQEEARKKAAEALKKKKEKDPLEISRLAVQPHDEILLPMMKRGHWCVADQSMIANFENFVGDLDLKIVDQQGSPIALDRTRFRMPSMRPVSLSKGRAKNIKTTFFAPTRGDAPSVATRLNQHGSMGLDTQSRVKAHLMPPYQYHFVVLAKNPARYTYVKTLDVISMPNGGLEESVAATDGSYLGDNDVHYRVVLPNVEKHVPLPDHCLLWSTIAYVLWDDIAPDRLSLDQRQAMVDWLHWGGQLIVSGPGSLDLLKNSFLNSYLPAEDGGATQIEQASLDDLGAQWRAKNTSLAGGVLKASQPWSGIRLKLRPESKFVPNTAELLADRRIGRGRIVVTAFRLDLPDFIHWKAVHGFYNSCLMLRPHRKWTYANFAQLNWADIPERRFDAKLTCGLRFFSRDAGLRTNFKKMTREAGDEGVWTPGLLARGGFDAAPAEEWVPPEEAPGGVAAWNDFNASANAARESLRIAAGVTVPRAGFILGVLAVYLIFLVPINGMFFHAIGRVEWAWIAAPLIALAGTMVVVWQAQLDIGFVRARTDVAIIETHHSHPRAHITRFTALYTSLGTTYDFQSDNPTSLIQPFPVRADYELIQNQAFSDVVFRKHQDVRLTGYNVSSNTTNMVRSEQIVDLEGMIRLGTNSLGHPLLINGSRWDVADVAIVQRPNDSKKLLGCWVGRLKAGVSSTIRLEPLSAAPPFVKERKEEARSRPVEDVHMEPLIQLALDTATIDPGEIRMVGRVEGILPGIKITPDASQVRGAALIVSHLKHGTLRPPKPDINYRVDVDRLAPQDGGGE